MKLRDHVHLARRSLSRHPLRTTLTMLGMIIGVASVIVMTSLGLGARQQVEREIARLGTNLLTVQPLSRATDTLPSSSDGRRTLSEDDALALRNEIAGVVQATPVVNGSVRLVFGNQNWQTTVIGTHPEYLPARDWHTGAGRNFTMQDVTGSAKVVLVGRTVQEKLSPLQPLLGRIIRINGVPFRVIGLLSEKGHSANGQDQDNLIVAPISTVKSRLLGGYYQVNRKAVAYLLVKGRDANELNDLESDIERVLRHRHRAGPVGQEDFQVRDPVASLSASKTASETMTLLLACIAAVSLLVGGISIMNIMLVSVAERTREIGIRIAVGATRGDVRRQFLTESAGVALLGGAIGAALGSSAALAINVVAGWEVFIDVWICLGTIAFSAFVGLFSGFYPALRASMLDPMEAIRM